MNVGILEKIYESKNSIIYKGLSPVSENHVVVKILNNEFPTEEEIQQFNKEYEIINELKIKGIRKVLAKDTADNKHKLILEYFEGQTLREYLLQNRQPISELLKIAVAIAQIVGEIHQQKIIHKDINSQNILINSEKEIRIIDFGISSKYNLKVQNLSNPDHLEGTLAYISPEQTGRMNRTVDSRTDLYSLGIVLYELFTGKLPFADTDSMQLIHAHIARMPKPLYEINPIVPKQLSNIVLKLLEKNAENRYQSAFGLMHDLQKTAHLQDKPDADFPLGEKDFSGKLAIPEILYGREQEVKQLIDIYEHVTHGRSEMLVISGFSGVGKSALVHEIHKPVTEQQGIYIEGKFDQFQRNIPYFAIIQAFTDAINIVLKEDDTKLNYWKTKIQHALQDSGKVITNVIPDLELIIGKQPELPKLEGKESQNRFNYVWTNFVKAMCSPQHPLVMFIDDMQWADSASLNLLKVLLTDKEIKHFLCITAYRDNETDAAHPFIQLLEELNTEETNIKSFNLGNLSDGDINHLLLDALNSEHLKNQTIDDKSLQNFHNLSAIIFEKTLGNAFFIQQFIRTLYEEKLLYFDFEKNSWVWDIADIKTTNITDNVLDLMANKIIKLPDVTQDALKIAACIGNRFDIKILASIYSKSYAETGSDLEPAIYEGLIIPTGGNGFKFVHDKIQQAVYSTIPDETKHLFHYKTGKILIKNSSEKVIERKIFDIVNQLNHGIGAVSLQDSEIETLIDLNLKAGNKAKLSSAYETADKYFEIAEKLLPSDAWKNNYETTLQIYSELTEIAYLNGDYAKTERYVEIVDKNAANVVDTALANFALLNSLRAQARYEEAISKGIDLAGKLGVKIPKKANKIRLIEGLLKTSRWITKNESKLYNLPKADNQRIYAAVKILDAIGTSAFNSNPQLLALMVFKGVQLVIKYGYYESSSYSISAFGMILCNINKIEKAQTYGELATYVEEKFKFKSLKCKTAHMNLFLITNWKKQIHSLLPDIYNNYKTGLETGDFEFAGFSLMFFFGLSIYCKTNLKELKINADKHANQISKLSRDNSTKTFVFFIQLIDNLTSESLESVAITGKYFDETSEVENMRTHKAYSMLMRFYQSKLFISYLFGKPEVIDSLMPELETYKEIGKGYYFHALLNFYKSLCLLAVYNSKNQSEQKNILKLVAANQKQLGTWAKHCPENFEHKFNLVEAEKMRVLGNSESAKAFYDKAIVGANTYEFIQEEALAYEAAARFHFEQKQDVLGRNYLQNAYRTYTTWGATAKVSQLENLYPEYISNKLIPSSATDATTMHTISRASTTHKSSGNLELDSILKASQSLSGEVNIESLLKNMMMIVMENAGAEYAVFLKNEDGIFNIQAKGNINTKDIEVMQSEPIENSMSIPPSIIKYVLRTNKLIVLDDAFHDKTFTDTYIQTNQTKSIFCQPITHKNKLVAVLYLENNLSTHVFTPKRIETVSILSSQIAVSIENATLYANLEQKVEQRTLQLQNAKNELELSHKNITDSILYAKRIQDAVIPKQAAFTELFSNHFVIFKPKDIVSGDFYFVKKLEHKIYIAAVDCTGHGVPGAFMSMLGMAFLNELVQKSEIQTSAQVLNELRNYVKQSLQQTGQVLERQDGMDIAFVSIDTQTNTLNFAGAHNPLWMFRNSQLIEIKADRMPVGIYRNEHPFTDHTTEIRPDDMLYLFSDGFYSQFKHDTKETMKINRFKALLTQIHTLDVSEQKQKLEHYLAEWAGHEAQIDDILVLGLRI